MESLLHTSSATSLVSKLPKLSIGNGFSANRRSLLKFPHGFSYLVHRKQLTVQAKKKKNGSKEDAHSFIPKPDEATGPFPEAVLLKKKKVQDDGTLLPEFADAEEEKLYEFLSLQLESELNVERMRHYEVVYLIHEKHEEEVGNVNEKIQDFIREKKGKIWRMNDWGLRRLAYKIQKAKNAHYILMNFELEAKWINDFKTLLDKDERVIRHLVIKRDNAITEDCPPPPEWHTRRAGTDDYDEEGDVDYDEDEEDYDEDWDGEDDVESYDDNDFGDDIIAGDNDEKHIDDLNKSSGRAHNTERRNLKAEKVAR